MKPESAAFLKQAESCIDRGATMLTVGLAEDAARSAYLACFHVAQALIFERTGKTAKTHHGVQTEFFRLTKDGVPFDAALRRFLSQAYEFKLVADYGVAADPATSIEEAEGALETARQFKAHFSGL